MLTERATVNKAHERVEKVMLSDTVYKPHLFIYPQQWKHGTLRSKMIIMTKQFILVVTTVWCEIFKHTHSLRLHSWNDVPQWLQYHIIWWVFEISGKISGKIKTNLVVFHTIFWTSDA